MVLYDKVWNIDTFSTLSQSKAWFQCAFAECQIFSKGIQKKKNAMVHYYAKTENASDKGSHSFTKAIQDYWNLEEIAGQVQGFHYRKLKFIGPHG
jgi:hypothetical protein